MYPDSAGAAATARDVFNQEVNFCVSWQSYPSPAEAESEDLEQEKPGS